MKALLKNKDGFLYLLMLAFVLILTSVISMTQPQSPIYSFVSAKNERSFAPLPVLTDTSTFPVLSGEAALSVDLDSGVALYEKNPDSSLLPASTTKIVTALVAMDYYPLDAVLKVGRVTITGQKMGLKAGEETSVNDLLYG